MSSSDDSCESQYAMAEIEYPGVHDVLCGRGGHAISHSGNVNFRMMVEKFKTKYATVSRYEKAKVIAEVVRMWRSQSPPGRFLIISDPSKGESSKWHDIGDNAASKKVAQCLRERNPRAEYTAGQPTAPNPTAVSAAADPVASNAAAAVAAAPVPTAPTSSAVVPPPFTGTAHHTVDWKRRKSSKKQKQRKQEVRQEPKSKSAIAHQQQHPKHQGQRQRQQQNAQNRHQNALKKQVQKQVEIAEQEVWQAQQQVNQQAHELQTALMQRAQQEAAAAAATQVVLSQMALQQVEQEIWKEQNLVNQKMQQQHQPQQQPQQQFQQESQGQHADFQERPQQVQFQEDIIMDNGGSQHDQRQGEQDDDDENDEGRQGTQENSSDTMSSLDSPLMWDDCQGPSCNGNGSISRRDCMAREIPSAARLTKHAFDDDTNNGSSDSSTATSGRMAKMIYSKLDTFSDTTSENSNDNCGRGDSNDGAISDGSNSIARPDAYPPD